jgi:hypothetical protein
VAQSHSQASRQEKHSIAAVHIGALGITALDVTLALVDDVNSALVTHAGY